MKLRANLRILRALNSALRHCDMRPDGTCGVAPEHKKAMELYLQTWVAGPIRDAIKDMESKGQCVTWR